MKHVLSKDWTAEERLVLMVRLAGMVQTDVLEGRYGAVVKTDSRGVPTEFRPNCQSIIEVGLAPRWLLERSREDLQKLLDEDDGGVLEEELERLWSGESWP